MIRFDSTLFDATLFEDTSRAGLRPKTRNRAEIGEAYKWRLSDIYEGWEAWTADFATIRKLMDEFVALEGTLKEGADVVLRGYELSDQIGMLSYKLYRYPQLMFDVDQRDNAIQSRLQEVQILFAEYGTRTSWFSPEMLTIDEQTMTGWVDATPALGPYRFPIAEIYRSQKHVLDAQGEQLLSLASRFRSTPGDIYRALSTADIEFKTIELTSGEQVTVSYGEYQNILHTNPNQADRAKAFEAMYEVFNSKRNTIASLYNAVCQRDWAQAQARHYTSTAEAALDDNAIPLSVLETLISTARAGTEPLRRYHALRKRVLGLATYHLYDGGIALVENDKLYPYDEVAEMIVGSVAPLGERYQQLLRESLTGGWIDVYENDGKRSGAYSAGVYGVHPYILLNYNDTLDQVFTLAHELGHSMHTVLSSEHQPFATASYTIFVAEVASTTNEALLLDYMLARVTDPRERIVLLQKAIDGILGTFYSQALFADYELQAHRLAEQGKPITAEALSTIYEGLMDDYYGPEIDRDELYRVTWARIPHFFNAPYYVYQYATCYASSAKIVQGLLSDDATLQAQTLERYLTLLSSGGNDHPMNQLQEAGIDLSQDETVQAVVDQLSGLVDQLERELAALETA
ncbi:MAG: oligoendopeptidase F [Bradymonadaceae bacterium]|nr:oligoendopeptidase F [Lujinxingiaceae bacterium]